MCVCVCKSDNLHFWPPLNAINNPLNDIISSVRCHKFHKENVWLSSVSPLPFNNPSIMITRQPRPPAIARSKMLWVWHLYWCRQRLPEENGAARRERLGGFVPVTLTSAPGCRRWDAAALLSLLEWAEREKKKKRNTVTHSLTCSYHHVNIHHCKGLWETGTFPWFFFSWSHSVSRSPVLVSAVYRPLFIFLRLSVYRSCFSALTFLQLYLHLLHSLGRRKCVSAARQPAWQCCHSQLLHEERI